MMNSKLAERYVAAVENEARRNELYTQLISAQLRHDHELSIRLQAEIDQMDEGSDP